MSDLVREFRTNNILVWEDGKESLQPRRDVLAAFAVDGIIRIQEADYDKIPDTTYFGHFNLETAGHLVGKTYILPKILRSGSYSPMTREERLPLLTFENVRKGICLECKERLSYEEVLPEFFAYSMTDVKDIPSLKRVIVERYKTSLPDLSEAEILSRGVAFTLLRFI